MTLTLLVYPLNIFKPYPPICFNLKPRDKQFFLQNFQTKDQISLLNLSHVISQSDIKLLIKHCFTKHDLKILVEHDQFLTNNFGGEFKFNLDSFLAVLRVIKADKTNKPVIAFFEDYYSSYDQFVFLDND